MSPSFLLTFDFEKEFNEILNTKNIATDNITNKHTIITTEPNSHNNNNTITTNIIKVESKTEQFITKNELTSSNNNTNPITEPPTQAEMNTTD